MFLDIHTHYAASDANIKKLFNLDITEADLAKEFEVFFDQQTSISLGIHPWSVSEEHWYEQLEVLEYLSQDDRVKAIGEIGLDKLKGPDMKLQEEVFLKQIRVAEIVRKPILIHCVKSFNELIAIKKVVRPKVPMIIHGFNRNAELAEELAKKGFYISFGKAVLTSVSVCEALKKVPLEQIFFETDVAMDLNIGEVYTKAGEVLNIDLKELEDRIYQNYLELYL